MARSWQYPRWRRCAMQGTLWLLLGATVALAALVNHERRRSMRVELGPPTSHGWLTVRLPSTWQQSAAPDVGDRVIARAVEPDPQGLGRTVTVTRDRVARPISPLEFLLTSNSQILGLDLLHAQHARGAEDLVEPITVGGHPGVLMRGVRGSGRGPGGLPHKEIYGATITPSGHAIVVKLEGDRPAELSDIEIVKQLADAIEIGAQPSIGRSGETVALEGGIRFAAPEGFRPLYENDPNLLRRRLWPDGDATRWAAAELIPCVLAPTENNDETMAIRALAAVHDPALRDAVVAPDGPRRWRITRSGAAGPFAARGYLVADELGDSGAITGTSPRRAMMAFFHGAASASSDDVAAIDRAWDALARSVSFVGKTNFGALLDAGNGEVERLRKLGLLNLLGDEGEQWWLWTDQHERRPLGWSHVQWKVGKKGEPPEKTFGRDETVFQQPGGPGRKSSALTKWTGEWRTYDAYTTITPADPGAEPVMSRAQLSGDKLSMQLAPRGRPVAEGTGAAPPQYIPGAWVPLLIGRLSPIPMILKTDALLAGEPVGAPLPMLLMVEPVTEQPMPVDADGDPLRTVCVRVNGSSESSRWYVRANGELQRVTFARGLVRTPTDRKTKWFIFGDPPPGQ
ncbi:MAG TPA: hypothetical protein VGR35_18940 [Tepidisphaeraceae bacterium]|nr:hypothetical protein [Tepidisphaeraceae bacterium]